MTQRTEQIRQLLRQGSYSLHSLQLMLRKPNGKRWSLAAIETSVRSIKGVAKDGNLYTIEP
jgi:hypothetical protein